MVVLLSVFAVAFALRALPLYWSPLPATLDGIEHAAHARDTIALGHVPLTDLRADHLVFVTVLSMAGAILNVAPITLAQPFSALVGAVSCIVAMALVHRVCVEIDWSARRTRLAVVLTGLSLAASGVYLRRTGLPDEELLVHVSLPLLALSLHRALLERERRWTALTVVFLALFPITHTFSTSIALLVVTGVVTLHVTRDPEIGTVAAGVALVTMFWAYVTAYYWFAARSGVLTVPYVGRILSFPGLFLAWIVVLVVGVLWFQRTSRWARRTVFLVPIAVGFLAVVVNAVQPVFPETVATPLPIAAFVAAFSVPVVLASGALSVLGAKRSTAIVLLALLAGPVAMVYFSLTASLTPEYFGTVMRAQTFAHLPVFALSALATARIVVPDSSGRPSGIGRRLETPGVRALVVFALLGSVVASAPIAYVNLDTASFPSTTTESEFEATAFATNQVQEGWTGDHTLTKIAGHYHYEGGPANGTMYGAREWLRGGPTPCRPTLSQYSWTTTGAHFFPAAPETVPPNRYTAWIAERNLVYTAGGIDPASLSLPRTGSTECQ